MARTLSIDEIPTLSLEEYRKVKKIPLVLILDNIRSQHNIGSLFRTADAFRIEALYLCGITACPPQPEIHKAALGATESVVWKYFGSTADAIGELRASGYTIAGLERAEGSRMIEEFDPSISGSGWAVIIGNEVKGISQEIMSMTDMCIELRQSGTKHSLNVSIAGGILMWEFYRFYRQSI